MSDYPPLPIVFSHSALRILWHRWQQFNAARREKFYMSYYASHMTHHNGVEQQKGLLPKNK